MRVHLCLTLLCSVLVSTALGCSSKVATLTMFSTHNVDMSQAHHRLERAKATDNRLWLVFPLGGAPSGLEAAVDLIDAQNADDLTNVDRECESG